MNKSEIGELLQAQREYFATGVTTHYINGKINRTNALGDLRDTFLKHEADILAALEQDLGKTAYEAYTTEIIPVLQELDYVFKKGGGWLKERKVMPNKLTMHGSAKVQYVPKGCVLILSPWNYPVQLTLLPLIPAILAGNTCIIKPSEQAPHTSRLLAEMINNTFAQEYIHVVEGDAEVAKALLAEKFDHIFFTGSPAVGQQVMQAAARNFASVTLELGGKSPCIVTPTANIYKSAKSIAWAKLLNCGQTCVAPDYVLVCEEQKEAFISSLVFAIREFYGAEPMESPDYGRIVNRQHFDRIMGLIEPYKGSSSLVLGGQSDPERLKIAPTIIAGASLADGIMQEEIFGPVLPVLTYDKLGSAVRFINSRPTPLACYLFTDQDNNINLVKSRLRCGGLCINDAITQMLHPELPFGGMGASGMGRYHGEAGFREFSCARAIFHSRSSASSLRQPPYSEDKLRKLLQTFKLGVFAKNQNLR